MKINMKKIIVAILAFVFLLSGIQNVFADSIFNGQSGDCSPAVGIGVYPNNIPRDNYGCWTSTSIHANPGDIINVAMYYHNNTDTTLTNVKASITKSSSGPANTFTFTGRIYSDQGSQTLGTVTLNLSSSQTLTYSSTHIMKGASAVKNNQDTSVVHNDGGRISIGNVPSGWDNYGEVLAVFKVGDDINYNPNPNPTPNPVYVCSVSNFTVNGSTSTTVTSGDSVNLSWTSNGCNYVNIPGVGANLPANGNATANPTYTRIYSITGYGNFGSSQSRTVKVTVNPVNNPTYACMISNFTVNGSTSTTVTSGDSVSFSWNTSNCNSVSITPNVGTNLDPDGSATAYPGNSTTYRLTAYSSVGSSQSRTVKVTVNPVNNPTYACMITNFTADGGTYTTIEDGDAVNLSWSTDNCNSVNISGVGNSLSANGSKTIYPSSTKTYRITANGTYFGSSQSRTVKVTVNPKVEDNYYCSISRFEVDDSHISSDENTRLRWNTNDCSSVYISHIGSVSDDGSRSISPNYSTSYTLTAYGSNGIRKSRTLYVTVDHNNNYYDNNYYYNYNDYNNCSISRLSLSRNHIDSGSSTRLSWNTDNCSSVYISGLGYVSSDGSRTLYPNNSTTYTLTAYNSNGQRISRSIPLIVNTTTPTTNVYNSCAITTVTTNVTQNTATLHGTISGSGGYTNTYFEYGPNSSLGSRTQTKTYSGNTSFSETISGLSPNTNYYFRFVANCNGTQSNGSLGTFRTLNPQTTQVTRPIIVQGTTVTGSSSPVMLKIEDRYEAVGRGDTIEYTVTYKNIGKNTLKDPVLQVVVPKGFTITNSSKGNYSEDTKTLTAKLDDLKSGKSGEIYVQGYVNSIPSNTAQLVTTALLVYTNSSGAQENAIAYVINIPKEFNNSLGAAALFGNLWGIGLIGWLLIIIIILIIILIIHKYFYRPIKSSRKR